MREIKFRGRTPSGKWVYGYYVGKDTIIPFENVNFDLGFIDTSPCYEVIPDSIGQFTGLHDKNGKEIYEGDIVSTSNYGKDIKIGNQIKNVSGSQLYEVKMLLCNFVLDSKYRSHYLIYYKDYEVIGNIHDNPELLNE